MAQRPMPLSHGMRPWIVMHVRHLFARTGLADAASGVILLLCAAIALAWANSRWSSAYFALWQTPIAVHWGHFACTRSLEWIVNDALMVAFFLFVGLEVRREISEGALSGWRRASLPVAAAFGGMVVPACLFLCIAGSTRARGGWGVPIATDIAFALGVLTLLGRRVPPALRALLLALAVADDVGAIVVIAVFYSPGIVWAGVALAAVSAAAVLVMQRAGVGATVAYVAPAIAIWAGVAHAGIHPTFAGVIIGLLTPTRSVLAVSEKVGARAASVSPARSLGARLRPWVAFCVMPIFALANAGVVLASRAFDRSVTLVVLGCAFALFAGKPAGVLLASWAAVKLRLAAMPRGVNARHIVVLGALAGIGFTMALFVAGLAFTDPTLLSAAKQGVLLASVCSAVLALILGRSLLPVGEIVENPDAQR